jgi:DNA-binding response OmpR family regulator
MHILLIENDSLNKANSLATNLTKQEHLVSLAHTPENAAQQASNSWPNLILINASNGELDLSKYKQMLSQPFDIPCCVVGNQAAYPDADDYQFLPSSQKLNAALEEIASQQENRFTRLPGLVLDRQYRRVLHQGKTHSLTPKEYKLLFLLLDNANEILSRKAIMQHVWETDYMGDTRTLDVHIRWLREKIEDNPSRPTQLVTIRGVGYRFVITSDSD